MKKKPAKKTKSPRVVRVNDPEWRKQHHEYHAEMKATAARQEALVDRFVVAFERIAAAEEKEANVREKQDTRIAELIEKFEKQVPDLLSSLVSGSKPKENPS